MASGGYRPGAGRKTGTKNSRPRKGSKAYEALHDKKPRKRKDGARPEPTEPTEAEKIKAMLSFGTRAKAKIYQEYLQRLSQGGTLSVAEKRHMDKVGGELETEIKVEPELTANAAAENMTPLEYMLKVMNDPQADKDRRDRMAIASAPFCHPRKGEGMGKKDEKTDRAKAAGEGKYAPSKPPLKVVK